MSISAVENTTFGKTVLPSYELEEWYVTTLGRREDGGTFDRFKKKP